MGVALRRVLGGIADLASVTGNRLRLRALTAGTVTTLELILELLTAFLEFGDEYVARLPQALARAPFRLGGCDESRLQKVRRKVFDLATSNHTLALLELTLASFVPK